MDLIGYTSQGNFLLHGGLDAELASFADLPAETQVSVSGQVKQLTLPAEMGENFKVIGLGRGETTTIPALCVANLAHQL
jgi:SAM-dependent MidA family methyltransferase